MKHVIKLLIPSGAAFVSCIIQIILAHLLNYVIGWTLQRVQIEYSDSRCAQAEAESSEWTLTSTQNDLKYSKAWQLDLIFSLKRFVAYLEEIWPKKDKGFSSPKPNIHHFMEENVEDNSYFFINLT